MAEVRPYYSDKGLAAAYYDLVTELDPGVRGDTEAYAALTPPGGSILELGSGAGRVSFSLAERGFSVLGLDLAPPAPRGVPVLQAALPEGRMLRLYIHERKSRLDIGRHDQTADYRVETMDGRVERQTRERLTFYVGDPVPVAEAAGLFAEGGPIAMGGSGEIRVFRKGD